MTRTQARAHGLDRHAIRRRIASGELVAEGPTLLRLTAAPLTTRARLGGALLETSETAALGFATAAHLFQIPGFAVDPIQVLVERGWHRRATVHAGVHTTRSLPTDHVLWFDDLRVTTPTRTLFDLASAISKGRLERALGAAWSLHLTDGPRLFSMLEEIRRSGRNGVAAMDELLGERGIDWIPPESGLERRFHELIRRDGQSAFRIQVGVGDDTMIGRVDALDDDASLIVEIQSDRFHRSPSDVAADRRRRQELEAAGWQVVEVWEHEVWHEPGPMLARIRQARLGRQVRRAA